MNKSVRYLQQKRQALAAEYGIRRRRHDERADTAKQLKQATSKLLRAELAAQRDAERRAAKAGTIGGDLDLFIHNA